MNINKNCSSANIGMKRGICIIIFFIGISLLIIGFFRKNESSKDKLWLSWCCLGLAFIFISGISAVFVMKKKEVSTMDQLANYASHSATSSMGMSPMGMSPGINTMTSPGMPPMPQGMPPMPPGMPPMPPGMPPMPQGMPPMPQGMPPMPQGMPPTI